MVSKRELRLGNVFEQGIVCKINGRAGAKVHLHGKLRWDRKGVKVIESLGVGELKPVLLTREVLVDWCGFETDGDVYWKEGDLFGLGHFANDRFKVLYKCSLREQICDVWYLHELQNLYYALNKRDLEIKG